MALVATGLRLVRALAVDSTATDNSCSSLLVLVVVTGYVPLSNILQGIYESNGSFYSAGQFNDQVIDPGVEAQRQTLAVGNLARKQ